MQEVSKPIQTERCTFSLSFQLKCTLEFQDSQWAEFRVWRSVRSRLSAGLVGEKA